MSQPAVTAASNAAALPDAPQSSAVPRPRAEAGSRGRSIALSASMGVILLLALLVTLVSRIAGPSDVYDKDQSKTMAYTVDAVRHGNWALPRDDIRQPATKPPLYNWLAAPVPMVTGLWDEWVHKLPSMLAGVATIGLIVGFGRRQFARLDVPVLSEAALPLALLAGAIWVSSFPAQELIYLARPDMLLTAFLIGAWVCGDLALREAEPTARRTRLAIAFWLCIAGAALTKGPAAVIPLLYVLLTARLVHGSWRVAGRLNWRWGLTGVFAVIGAWCVCAAIANPEHFGGKLMFDEFLLRVVSSPPEDKVQGKPAWHVLSWFKREFLPWSILAGIGGLAVVLPLWRGSRWRFHPLFPAALWGTLVALSIAISRGKRADYLAPIYPAAALLAAYAVALPFHATDARRRLLAAAVPAAGVLAIGVSLVLAHFRWTESMDAVVDHGRHLKAFRDEIAPIVKDEPLVFLIRGYQPLLPLMGRHTGRRPTVDQLLSARWLIVRQDERWPAVAVSEEVSSVIRGLTPGNLALYDLRSPNRPTEENLLEFYALEDPLVRRLYTGEPPPPAPKPAPSTQPATKKAKKKRD